ncbi:MAG: hypothetical protein L6W00_02630 [Lentisphaeria bacterium]|nr:MAG: hypothetical protein L6W00_02630 [Lentisphaeria bacterium]
MNETVAKFAWDFPLGMTGLCLALAAGVLLIVLSYFFTLRKLRPFWRGGVPPAASHRFRSSDVLSLQSAHRDYATDG